MRTVAILGGGVAGLTAAHELAERGFEVTLFEKRATTIGGKARSEVVLGSGVDGRKPLPGEHGFRFFPGFYKHVPDTMRRIPFAGSATGVFGNLVPAPRGLFALNGRAPFDILMRLPQSFSDLKVGLELPGHLEALGLTRDDLEFFCGKLLQVLTSCQARRIVEYDRVGWWEFIGAAERSKAYQLLLATGLTRNAVATKAHSANARTISDIAIQLMLNMSLPGEIADRVLCGPTTEMWLAPWADHLTKNLGVKLDMAAAVTAIKFDGRHVTGVTVQTAAGSRDVTADAYVCALPLDQAADLVPPAMAASDPNLAGLAALKSQMSWMSGIQFYLKQDPLLVKGHVNCIDSPWALTAISQAQFWPSIKFDEYGDGSIRDIVSVDISDWQSPSSAKGPAAGKAAIVCTRDEIAAEVWYQLKESLNYGGVTNLTTYESYWLDDAIVEDRATRTLTNEDVLLVNEADSWRLRPDAATLIPNFVLAGDYVRTSTDFASMESANEAARRAVNALLACAAYRGALGPCQIWPLHEPDAFEPLRAIDEYRFVKGHAWTPPLAAAHDVVTFIKAAAGELEDLAARTAAHVEGFVKHAVHDLLHPDARHLQESEIKGILERNAHRADPLPSGEWATFQKWRNLLFAHWPIPAEAIRARVPEPLEIELFEGDAYISLVAMQMARICFRTLGNLTAVIPGETHFPELNVRTYVRHGDIRGVYFFRADAPALIADLGARVLFSLPYGEAVMNIDEAADGTIGFRSHRTMPPTPDATYVLTFKPSGPAAEPAPGSRTAFVRNRDYAFVGHPGGKVRSVGLLHDPWQVQEAQVEFQVNTVLSAGGLELPSRPIACDFSREIDVLLWNASDI